jgi:hypothetical protein
MTRSTLALAYAARVAPSTRPATAAAVQPLPPAAAQTRPAAPAFPLGLPLHQNAPRGEAQAPLAQDALLIAVRRSLASCRDSSQLRMLAAFESVR